MLTFIKSIYINILDHYYTMNICLLVIMFTSKYIQWLIMGFI